VDEYRQRQAGVLDDSKREWRWRSHPQIVLHRDSQM
jgi:hypothetical protein